MIAKHDSKSLKNRRPRALPLSEEDLLRNMEARLPEVLEEETSEPYWGSSDSYYETYFDLSDRE